MPSWARRCGGEQPGCRPSPCRRRGVRPETVRPACAAKHGECRRVPQRHRSYRRVRWVFCPFISQIARLRLLFGWAAIGTRRRVSRVPRDVYACMLVMYTRACSSPSPSGLAGRSGPEARLPRSAVAREQGADSDTGSAAQRRSRSIWRAAGRGRAFPVSEWWLRGMAPSPSPSPSSAPVRFELGFGCGFGFVGF